MIKLFKKRKQAEKFFQEAPLDDAFDEMMGWIKDLSRKDYNRLKKAMDYDYDAYQALHGINPDDGPDISASEFMLSEEGE